MHEIQFRTHLLCFTIDVQPLIQISVPHTGEQMRVRRNNNIVVIKNRYCKFLNIFLTDFNNSKDGLLHRKQHYYYGPYFKVSSKRSNNSLFLNIWKKRTVSRKHALISCHPGRRMSLLLCFALITNFSKSYQVQFQLVEHYTNNGSEQPYTPPPPM